MQQTSVDIRGLEHGISFQNGLPAGTFGEHGQHHGWGDPTAPNHGLATHFPGFGGDASEEVSIIHGRSVASRWGNEHPHTRSEATLQTRLRCDRIHPSPNDIYLRYHDGMNRRYRRIPGRIFTEPTPADLRWRDIEALLLAVGADVSEGSGSRVRVALDGGRAVFHRPHPVPETKRGLVRAVRDFLAAAGVTPEKD